LTIPIILRDVLESDLMDFFDFQLDEEANEMAAFTSKDPTNREAFLAHWQRIMADKSVLIKTIVVDEKIAGSVLSYLDEGKQEVSYWLGKDFWGKGICTFALQEFLRMYNTERPIYARVAKDNIRSRRVLEKNGFQFIEETKGFANARGTEIEEILLELNKTVPYDAGVSA